MRVLRAAMTDADEGALATLREALDAGREVDADTLAKLGFAARANLDEAQLVLGDRRLSSPVE